jgi:peptidoglycan/xylan/chitin deacetylase (PgdA/CDA1 family)
LLQNSGAEVGLHIDPLQVYLNEGFDGAAAVKEELRWLRSIGLRIRGTSAHNAAPVYGAENFEIFKGRAIHGERFLYRNYRFVPLAVLDEKDLSLSYEAGDASPSRSCKSEEQLEKYLRGLPQGDFIRDTDWFRTYVLENPHCSWGYSYRIWLLGKDMWVIAGIDRKGEKVFRFQVSWTTVSQFLDNLREDEQCMICLHPIYLGEREKSGEWPIGSRRDISVS